LTGKQVGFCPRLRTGTVGACWELCSSHADCNEDLCCSNGCGHECRSPGRM